jgi:exopolysaccharide production protein ExoZ
VVVATKKLAIVQSLRGIAASMVVLMHFNVFIAPVMPSFSAFLGHGYLGVDVFFVVSGFIIYLSTASPDAREASGFLLRRFCRVVLPAWVALGLAALTRPPYLSDLIASFFFYPLQNTDPPFYGYSVLIVAWTLSYELVFYLLFAATLSFGVGRRHRGWVASLGLLGLVLLVQALLGGITLDATRAPLASGAQFPAALISLLANPMLLEFAIGIGLAWVYLNRGFERSPLLLCLVLLSALPVLYAVIQFQYRAGHGLTNGGLLALLIVFYALCLQALVDRGGWLSNWRLIGWCAALGEMSYSLYLVHPIVKSLMARQGFNLAVGDALGPYGRFALALLCSGLVAYGFYRWVEVPAQRLGRSLGARSPTLVAGLKSS